MKEVFEKINEKVEDLKKLHIELMKDGIDVKYHKGCKEMCEDIIEIVNQVEEEYAKTQLTADNSTCNSICSNSEIPNMSEKPTSSGADINVGSNDGWIPCSERLPRIGEQVMVCNAYGSVFTSHITYLNPRVDRYGRCHDFGSHYNVIAWQPLPEPYKPKGE